MAQLNMNVVRGDDDSFELTFLDAAGEPLNLTGATIFFTVKNRVGDDESRALITKEITSILNPTAGVAYVELTDTDTDLSPGVYVFDVQLKDSDGNISSSGTGKFVVQGDVTKRTT